MSENETFCLLNKERFVKLDTNKKTKGGESSSLNCENCHLSQPKETSVLYFNERF
ncbi:hypothetical protein BRCON_1315 [Candidatus Sumerlaea chitinivorans]|uniref:Uncharacterized protein n=1 Tax=Sumerlaea chitinivorans TaxID=2250252 RepID=A0A2Z4Y5W8_SUMC1|nr:hypothetical protein BRCON_1315 [Candidatus Sumerlaea chitinivorans]